jgi:thermostable 8-oxoguanine DNA glycosylase
LISKGKVDSARKLLAKLENGHTLISLTDEELFDKGDEFEAVYRFYKKHDCSIIEAREAIKHLRGN